MSAVNGDRMTIREWREERGFSQLDLSMLAATNNTCISRVESGYTSLQSPAARRMMKALEISRRQVVPVKWQGPTTRRNRLEPMLRAEVRGTKLTLRRAYDFLSDPANITHRAQESSRYSELLDEVKQEMRGT